MNSDHAMLYGFLTGFVCAIALSVCVEVVLG